LDDGTELMVFQIRQTDGGIDPFSSGTVIGSDGDMIHLNRSQFEIQVSDT
jgi:predicted secreted hydrolase